MGYGSVVLCVLVCLFEVWCKEVGIDSEEVCFGEFYNGTGWAWIFVSWLVI